MKAIARLVGFAFGGFAILGGFYDVAADRYSSTSYIIDASVVSSAGGLGSSSSYKLVSSAGESIVGDGASGSYKMGAGYVAQLVGEAPQAIQLALQPEGLVAYWPFNEGVGSVVADYSQNGLDGQAQGTPTWGTGKIDGAITLDAAQQQYIPTDDFDVSGSAITVEAWVYPTIAATSGKIVSKHNDTTNTQALLALSSGNATFSVTAGGSYYTATGGTVPTNAWTHLIGVYDGSYVRLYTNGTLTDSVVASGTLATNSLPWTIGRTAGATYTGSFFTGSIDEVKVFNRALATDEVAIAYTAGNAGNPAGVSLGTVTPGIPNTAGVIMVVGTTNVPDYTLSIQQDHVLQNGANTIPSVSATISSPAAWVDGTTKGLGLTLLSAPSLDGKWGAGANYAAIPGVSTTLYSRTGASNGAKDTIGARLKVDASNTTPTGTYTNVITVTVTSVP
ncbi:LamG domain-containing protein [Candidatus Saccharibacteria bacterium]|nr:LamG domain-containing protein [Candidatus Saccharibacteria bacterium]